MWLIWTQFIGLTLIIGYTGYKLSFFGDQLAIKTNLGRNLVGIILLSTVTSLPELVTGISSVTLNNRPNLAVGDILGSCCFNLSTVVLLDVFYRKGSVYSRTTQGHILTGLMGIILLAFVGFSLAIKDVEWNQFGHISITSLLIPVFYFLVMKEIFRFEKSIVSESTGAASATSVTSDLIFFLINSVIIVMAGSYLPFIAEEIINVMGWSASFVGTVFVAFATSLPEISITISALRMNAAELAFSNLLGSNIFNVVILAIDDFFYKSGSIFSAVSSSHTVTAFSVLMMTGLMLVALMKPPQTKILNFISIFSVLILGIYLTAIYVTFVS